ncbi:MAG: hypothetical protein ACYSW6_05885 [Planctomycetota bacterium]
MATFTWNYWGGTGPSWTDVATDTIVFSGTGGLTNPVTVAAWQDETHMGTGDPGTDGCGTVHAKNNKYISSTQFDNGSGTETLNDTNLTQDECTLQIVFTDASAVAITSARFYAYDGTTTTTEAVGVDVVAFEQGQSATTWTVINDDTVSGALTNGSIGGDNAGERLDIADSGSATSHTYYIAVSASPETVGAKTDFDFGFALTYS